MVSGKSGHYLTISMLANRSVDSGWVQIFMAQGDEGGRVTDEETCPCVSEAVRRAVLLREYVARSHSADLAAEWGGMDWDDAFASDAVIVIGGTDDPRRVSRLDD